MRSSYVDTYGWPLLRTGIVSGAVDPRRGSRARLMAKREKAMESKKLKAKRFWRRYAWPCISLAWWGVCLVAGLAMLVAAWIATGDWLLKSDIGSDGLRLFVFVCLVIALPSIYLKVVNEASKDSGPMRWGVVPCPPARIQWAYVWSKLSPLVAFALYSRYPSSRKGP